MEFKDIWFRYDKEYVLKGVSGLVREGNSLAIVGPTGSGKSTLLYAIANLLPIEKGEVKLFGREPLRREIGLLFQNPEDQLFNPSVYDEIAYSLRTLGLDEHEIEKRVKTIAKRLGIEGLLDKQTFKLSVGQKKMVALASILVYDPKVLLLDEPSANLDYKGFNTILKIIREELEKNKIVVLTTHDVGLAIESSGVICEMIDGRLLCSDTKTYLESLLEKDVNEVSTLIKLMKICKCTPSETVNLVKRGHY